MFKSGEIVIYKDKKYEFYCYEDDNNVYIHNMYGISYDCILVNPNNIVKYSIIEREYKFKNLLDV